MYQAPQVPSSRSQQRKDKRCGGEETQIKTQTFNMAGSDKRHDKQNKARLGRGKDE